MNRKNTTNNEKHDFLNENIILYHRFEDNDLNLLDYIFFYFCYEVCFIIKNEEVNDLVIK